MSWIDDEFERERERQGKTESDKQRELHRAKLIESKGIEIWGDSLRVECRSQVDEFVSKCDAGPRCSVVFEEVPEAKRFIVRHGQQRTHAQVILQLHGYTIEIRHITPTGLMPGEVQTLTSHLTFDCSDGLTVVLKREGRDTTIPRAAHIILKPVLFPDHVC